MDTKQAGKYDTRKEIGEDKKNVSKNNLLKIK